MKGSFLDLRVMEDVFMNRAEVSTIDKEFAPHIRRQGTLKHALRGDGDCAGTQAASDLRQAVGRVVEIRTFLAVYKSWDNALDQLKLMLTREHISSLPTWWVQRYRDNYAHSDRGGARRFAVSSMYSLHARVQWNFRADTWEPYMRIAYAAKIMGQAIECLRTHILCPILNADRR